MMDGEFYRRDVRWYTAILAIAVLVSFFYNLGTLPLFNLDEGAFGEATREMFARHDFISTYLNGQPRYDKPILIYWLQALSVSVLGLNELALRLPSALAATAWVLVVYRFTRMVFDTRSGLAAAIITATTLEVTVIGKAATADALLNLWIASSMLAIYLYYLHLQQKYLYLAYIAMALGFLTKGPVAAVIPLVVSLIFFALRGRMRLWLRAVFHPGGIGVFLLVAAPWYVVQYFKDPGFFTGFFLTHNLGRFDEPMQSHSGSLFYYVPVLIVGLLPYTAVFFKLLAGSRTLVRDDLALYMLLWFFFVLVLFSLSGTKLPHYVLYGCTPLFILMARQLDTLENRFLILLPPLLMSILLAAVPTLVGWMLPQIKDPFVSEMLVNYQQDFPSHYQVVTLVVLSVMAYFILENRVALARKLFLSGILLSLAISAAVLPAIGAISHQPVKDAAGIAKAKGLRAVVEWKIHVPSFNVYSGLISEHRQPAPGDVVLTKTIFVNDLGPHEVLFARNGIALIRMSAPATGVSSPELPAVEK